MVKSRNLEIDIWYELLIRFKEMVGLSDILYELVADDDVEEKISGSN